MTHSRMRRFVWTALVGLAALALVTGAWDYAARAGEAAPAAPKAAAKAPQVRVVPDNLEFLKDVVYGKVGDRELKLDILRPKQSPAEPMPVIVYIHGGGWAAGNKASMPGLCNRLADQGYLCVSVGYRFSQEAVFPAQIEDTKCAIRFLRAHAKEYKINPDRIGAWGHSAGGHLVALLGTAGDAKDLEGTGGWQDQSSRVQCVIDCFGPTDFSVIPKGLEGMKEQMSNPIAKLLGVPAAEVGEKGAKASPITYVSKDDPPILIMHGDADAIVPLDQSQRFYEALKKAGVDATLHIVKGAGHGFGGKEIEDVTTAFFDKNLKGK